jgi:hypothetical protein
MVDSERDCLKSIEKQLIKQGRPVAVVRQYQQAMSVVFQLAAVPHFYLSIPIQIKQRSGGKKVLLPYGETAKPKGHEPTRQPHRNWH